MLFEMAIRPRVVLLIGGHGRTSHYLTTILLSHGHTVYSLIRHTSQIPEIQKIAEPYSNAKLIPLVHDLNGISRHEVKAVLSQDNGAIEWVIWAAGAKFNALRHPQDQLSVERDAALLFINEARGEGIGPVGNVKRFIFISSYICRAEPASWWTKEDIEHYKDVKNEAMSTYVEAKTEVDMMLVEECKFHMQNIAKKSETQNIVDEDCEEGCFSVVSIRAGMLSDEPSVGKVQLGQTKMGMRPLSREDLARVVVELCETKGRRERGGGIGCRWLDVGCGGEEIYQAVERCIGENVDTSPAGEL